MSDSKRWQKIAALIVFATVAVWAWRNISREEVRGFIERASSMGWKGYLIFIVGYTFWCMIGLPASLLSLGAAAAYGFWRGFGVVWVGANCGAMAGFLLARYIARDWFEQRLKNHSILAQIDQAVGEGGWKVVLLTRLPPISPFSILNYAYGLTPVSFRNFAVGTMIGMIPGTMAYIYLGTILGDVAQSKHRARTPVEWAFYVGGFLVTVGVTIYMVRLAQAALKKRAENANNSAHSHEPGGV